MDVGRRMDHLLNMAHVGRQCMRPTSVSLVEVGRFREAVRRLGVYWLIVNQPPPPGAFAREGR